MSEQELKVILASAYCLNNLPNSRDAVNSLLEYMFKQCFGIDIKSLARYCKLSGETVLLEIAGILNQKTNYKWS